MKTKCVHHGQIRREDGEWLRAECTACALTRFFKDAPWSVSIQPRWVQTAYFDWRKEDGK